MNDAIRWIHQQDAVYEPLDLGRDSASPVSAAYESPYAFTGAIEQVRIDL